MKIRFTQQAYQDIDSVYQYICQEDPSIAQVVLDRIEKMIDHLSSHPELGREGRVEKTRELIVPDTPFIVAYAINESFIDVLAIIHMSKPWN